MNEPEEKLRLVLYIAGTTQRSQLAIENLRRICRQELRDRYDLQIVDVFERPQLAEDERIVATPTLIKKLPMPMRRLIGDMSETEKVLIGLDIRTADREKAAGETDNG